MACPDEESSGGGLLLVILEAHGRRGADLGRRREGLGPTRRAGWAEARHGACDVEG